MTASQIAQKSIYDRMALAGRLLNTDHYELGDGHTKTHVVLFSYQNGLGVSYDGKKWKEEAVEYATQEECLGIN